MILWRVARLDAWVASVRYRAVLPVLNLAALGYESGFASADDPLPSFDLDAVVFVKTFSAADLSCAKEARKRGVPVILDLCDNIFVPGYSALDATPTAFLAIARLASAIVVTTHPLAAEVRQRLDSDIPIHVIPDGVETAEEQHKAALVLATLWIGWRARDASAMLQAAWDRGELWVAFIRGLQLGWVRFVGAVRTSEARRRKRSKPHVFTRQTLLKAYRLLVFPFAVVRNLRTQGWPWLWHAIQRRFLRLKARGTGSPSLASLNPCSELVRAQCQTGPVKRLCWFGNAGAPYARFGYCDLVGIRDELLQVATRHHIRLVVISNSRRDFRRLIAPLGIEVEYHEWAAGVTETLLRDANVVLVPNSLDPFSRCKSANRALLALAHGVPVVATRTRALEPLSPCVIFDDWVGGIERYLEDKELAQAHLRVANDIIQREFSGLALAEEWKRLFACFGTRASRASSSSKNRLSRPVNCKHGQDEVCALGLREAEEVEGRTP